MARIRLLSQRVTKQQLLDSISGKKIGKTFFQFVLRSIDHNTATFGLLAYAAKKTNGIKKWNLGTPVYCSDGPAGDNREFEVPGPDEEPIAFGNLEVQLGIEESMLESNFMDLEDETIKAVEKESAKLKAFIQALNKAPKDAKLLAKPRGITKNPHVDYILEIEGTTSAAQANPCPPNQPGDN